MNPRPVTIGRIVHFVMQNGEHRAAIIVRVWDRDMLNLQVYTDGRNDCDDGRLALWETSIHFDGSPTPQPRTWHWPEQAAA